MKSRFVILILLFFSLNLCFGASAEKIRVSALYGPSSVSMAPLFETYDKAEFDIASAADVLAARLIKNETDVGILPPNLAAKLYNTTGKVIMGAVVGEGMLSVVTTDQNIRTFEDLDGKTVSAAGSGATPEYIFRYLCDFFHVQTEADFSIPTAELAAALASGKTKTILVPEPFATVACLNCKSARRVFTLQDCWNRTGSNRDSFPMTVVVFRTDWAKENPELAEDFLNAYKNAVSWVNKNPAETGLLTEKYSLGLKSSIVEQSVPYSNFVYKDALSALPEVEQLLSIFLSFAPEAVGKKLPDRGFYFDSRH